MKRFIVTTTINAPTKAVERFDAMEDWELIVIGDYKTPIDYKLARGRYVTPQEQEDFDPELSDAIGWNCIQRRNMGIAMAYEAGAEVVAVVDDDNIPLEGWGQNLMVGQDAEVNYYESALGAFDPIGATNYPHLWHRGYPLELLSKRDYSLRSTQTVHVDIQADFWNGDPDIDAICRLEHAPDCEFDPDAFPIAASEISPFNSQNTFLSRRVLKHYFLYPYVGRMDDIWAAYYVQALGYRVAYGAASVVQERNVHDLMRDMSNEIIGYMNNLALVTQVMKDPSAIVAYLPGKAIRAWDLYRKHFEGNE